MSAWTLYEKTDDHFRESDSRVPGTRRPDVVWVTWTDHRRSRELATAFGAEYAVLTWHAPRPIRYLILLARTFVYLTRSRPKLVFCQNPSIVLALLVTSLGRLGVFHTVVDRHSSFKLNTLDSWHPKWKLFHWLSRYTVKHADLTIVTNDYLCRLVDSWSGRGVVLQDRLPTLSGGGRPKLRGQFNLAFVCTFSDDEPWDAALEAFRRLPLEWHVYVTGQPPARLHTRRARASWPGNLHLTGFVPENQYIALLSSVDAIVVLTTYEHTLNCGAYEAVSLGKPMVLSDTRVIREYFARGVVYAAADVESIRASIEVLVRNLDTLRAEVVVLRDCLVLDWEDRFRALQDRIHTILTSPSARVRNATRSSSRNPNQET